MSKKISFIIIPILIILLVILMIDNKKINRKVITVDTVYSFLYSKNQQIEIPIYINDVNYPIDDVNSYQSIKIYSNDSEDQMSLEILEVTYSHSENYLNEIYNKYILKFKMPNLNENISIINTNLNITFIDNTKLDLKIGDIYLNYVDEENSLNWEAIDVKKNSTNDLNISNIIINLSQNYNIKSVGYNYLNELEFEIKNEVLTINIKDSKYFLNSLPLIIKTDNESITLENHYFVIEYDLLSKAKGIINIYEFN